MTLSTSVNKEGSGQERCRAMAFVTYICVTLFCLVFYLIYNIFSHGVHSPYMTYLFAWPLVLGVLPSGVMWGVRRHEDRRCRANGKGRNQRSKYYGEESSSEVSNDGSKTEVRAGESKTDVMDGESKTNEKELIAVGSDGKSNKTGLGHAARQEIGVEIWRAGVAAVTVSSCLRGIFEIAGTASVYQEWLMAAGAVMLVVGAALTFIRK